MMQLLDMARRGRIFLFGPNIRVNPIHGADLAEFCATRLLSGETGAWNVGGPEIFTWRELADYAFQALGRPAKVTRVPSAVLSPLVGALGVFNPRRADMMRFVSWSMLHDCVGEPTGTHRLLDFYHRHTIGRG